MDASKLLNDIVLASSVFIFTTCSKITEYKHANSSVGKAEPVIVAAVNSGNELRVAQILSEGYCVNFPGRDGFTLLHHAVFKDNIGMLKKLLSLGANPNVPDSSGMTPLMAASSRGYVQIVGVLLSSGANVNQADNGGSTAISYAIKRGNEYEIIVELLLSKGADVDRLSGGVTKAPPLFLALGIDEFGIASILLSHGARKSARDGTGNSIDYYLSERGREWLNKQDEDSNKRSRR